MGGCSEKYFLEDRGWDECGVLYSLSTDVKKPEDLRFLGGLFCSTGGVEDSDMEDI